MATHFFWDPVEDNIVQERDDTGAITAEYATEPYLYGNLISQNRGGVESQYHFDPQGSTLALTDDNQQVTDTYAYSAFGELTAGAGTTVNPYQYLGRTGLYKDAETGNYVAIGSSFSAYQGRWLSTTHSPIAIHIVLTDPSLQDVLALRTRASDQRNYYVFAANDPADGTPEIPALTTLPLEQALKHFGRGNPQRALLENKTLRRILSGADLDETLLAGKHTIRCHLQPGTKIIHCGYILFNKVTCKCDQSLIQRVYELTYALDASGKEIKGTRKENSFVEGFSMDNLFDLHAWTWRISPDDISHGIRIQCYAAAFVQCCGTYDGETVPSPPSYQVWDPGDRDKVRCAGAEKRYHIAFCFDSMGNAHLRTKGIDSGDISGKYPAVK